MNTYVVETRCGRVEYAELGSGTPILYFHGTGITCQGMMPIEAPLADSGFRVVMPNRPGYGRTPLAGHRSAADCSRVAASLLDALQIDSACVMGSSGGAAFASSFAVNFPGRTQCLTLLCPQLHRWFDKRWLPKHSRWTLPLLTRSPLRKLLLKLYEFQFRRLTIEQFLKMESGQRYATLKDNPEVRALCKRSLSAMVEGIRHPGFENDFVVFIQEDILSSAVPISVPTILLYDELDPIVPVEHIEWFSSLATMAELVSLQAGGHLIWAGRDAGLMHDKRVRFLKQNTRATSQQSGDDTIAGDGRQRDIGQENCE